MIDFVQWDRFPIQKLEDWIKSDPYHQDSKLRYWKPDGKEIIACWIQDSIGPVMYLKLDTEFRKVRMHVQFPPAVEVSRMRIARAIFQAWPRIVSLVKVPDVEGVVFESVSPDLIMFMTRLGFHHWKDRDYLYSFQET